MRREQGLLIALWVSVLTADTPEHRHRNIDTSLADERSSSSRSMSCWNGLCIQEFMTYMEFNSKVQNQSCMLQRGGRINICLT